MGTARKGRRRRRRGHPWLARLGVLVGFAMIPLGAGVLLFGLMIASGPAEFAPEPGLGTVVMLGGVAIGVGGWALARAASNL